MRTAKHVLMALVVGGLVLVLWPRAVGSQAQVMNFVSDGATPVAQRATSLANMFTAVTTTARAQIGALLVEKPSRWSAVSFPAANSQATATIAAEAGVRHVIDCVSFSADAAAAVTAAAGNVAIRDGATGAGTIIWQMAIAHLVAAAAGVQTIAPHSFCGLNLVGTTNTAMTAELNAGVTGEVQGVSMSGFNVQ